MSAVDESPSENESPVNGDRRTWHLDKSIPVAVLVSLLGALMWGIRDQSQQDERISLTERAVQTIQASQTYDRRRVEKKFDGLKDDMRRANDKLDQLIRDRSQ